MGFTSKRRLFSRSAQGVFVCVTAMLSLHVVALGADVVWNGGSGDWYSATSWSTGAIPDWTSDVFIDGGKDGVVSQAGRTGGFAHDEVRIHNLTIDAGDSLNWDGNLGDLMPSGDVIVNGKLTVGFGRESTLDFQGNSSHLLGGSGEIFLTRSKGATEGISIITGNFSIGPDVVVRGDHGVLGTDPSRTFGNHGTIVSDAGGTIRAAYFINKGVVRASGGHLILYDIRNEDGIIEIADGSVDIQNVQITPAQFGTIRRSGTSYLSLSGVVINNQGGVWDLDTTTGPVDFTGSVRGGTIKASAGSQLNLNPGKFYGVTLATNATRMYGSDETGFYDGFTLSNGAEISFPRGGTLSFRNSSGAPAPASIEGDGSFLLAPNRYGGPGVIYNYLQATLTIGPGITIHGGHADFRGSSRAAIVNNGTISLDVAQVPGDSSTGFDLFYVTNAGGKVKNIAGSTITAATEYTQTAGVTHIDGKFSSRYAMNISGGALEGSGSIEAPVLLGNGTVLSPGDSIGTLSVAGKVSFGEGSHLAIEVDYPTRWLVADSLTITGDLDLGAAGDCLDVVALRALPFGKTVTIATYSGKLTGIFDNVTPGYDVSYATPGQIRVTVVPEPACMLFGVGVVLLLRRRRGG